MSELAELGEIAKDLHGRSSNISKWSPRPTLGKVKDAVKRPFKGPKGTPYENQFMVARHSAIQERRKADAALEQAKKVATFKPMTGKAKAITAGTTAAVGAGGLYAGQRLMSRNRDQQNQGAY